MEQTERGRKAAEVELMEVGERANMLHTQNTALINHKRKLEGEVQNLQGEIEDAVEEQRNAEDKAKKAMVDVSFEGNLLQANVNKIDKMPNVTNFAGKFSLTPFLKIFFLVDLQ